MKVVKYIMSKWFSGILLILFILFPNQVKEGVKSGLDNGFLILIPSLFPYMVISQCFILTGGGRILSSFLYRPVNFFTGLTKKGTEIYLLSLFCGYPTGARLASICCDNGEIGKKEKQKLFGMANIPGFGFSVAYLGSAVFKSTWFGIKIYISFILASVFMGYFLDFFLKGTERKSNETAEINFQNALVKSTLDSSQAIISVIAFVCFFGSLLKTISFFVENALIFAVISGFTEITIGIPEIIKQLPNSELAVVFFTAFSGLSIIFQSMSFQKKDGINIFLFIFLRLLFGLAASIIFYLLHL